MMVGSVVALAAMFVMLARIGPTQPTSGSDDPDAVKTVMLFCAASNRSVMEEIREDYQKEYGVDVEIQYGPSQTLLSSLEVSDAGDLYLPADDSYLEMGREKGLIAEVLPIARMQGVIAVPRGNPKSIKSFKDLLRDDVRVVQASPDAAAIGKITRTVLQ